jgi:hypothetical protein
MIHGIGNVQMPFGIDRNRRREIQQRPYRRPSISAESPGNAGSIHDVAHSPAQVRLLRKSSFCRRPSLAQGVVVGYANSVRFYNFESLVRWCRTPSHRDNCPGHSIDSTDDVIFRIGDEQISLQIDGQSLRFIQARLHRRPSVTGQTGLAVSGNGSDGTDSRLDIHVN